MSADISQAPIMNPAAQISHAMELPRFPKLHKLQQCPYFIWSCPYFPSATNYSIAHISKAPIINQLCIFHRLHTWTMFHKPIIQYFEPGASYLPKCIANFGTVRQVMKALPCYPGDNDVCLGMGRIAI